MKYFLLTGIFFILLIFNSGNLNAAYNIGNEGCKPEIIFDETGNNLHCSFYRHWGTKGVYYKKNIDGVWGGEMTLADSVGSPKHPSIAVRGNKVAIVYVADSGNDIRIRISTNAGLSFLPEETIDDGQSSPYKWQSLPDVTIDSSGYVHVVWSVRDDSNSFWRILYRYRTTSWQAVTTVDNYSMVLKKPSICVDPEDNIHIAYDRRSWSGAGYKYIGYRQKLSSGIWSAAETVWSEAGANDWNNLMAPDIGIISGYLHIVWQTGGANPDLVNSVSQILYSRKTNQTGSTWSSQVTIGTGYVPCLSGYKDRIKVIWYDANPNKQVKSRLSQNKGAVFESPVIVTNNSSSPYFNTDFDPYYGIPFIFTSPEAGSLICWRDDDPGNYIIYKIEQELLPPPFNLYIDLVAGSSDSLQLKWKNPISYTPSGYIVYRATNFSINFNVIASNVVMEEYMDTGLDTSVQYKYRVQAVSNSKKSEKSQPSNLLSPGREFLINYFEGNEGLDDYNVYGVSILSNWIVTSPVAQGIRAQKIKYSFTGGWGAVLYSDFPIAIDISGYNSLRMWIKGDGSTNRIRIGFKEASDTPETYTSKEGALLINTNWHQVNFFLDDFERSDGTGNFLFDKQSIAAYQIVYSSQGISDSDHFIDRIYLENAGPVLNVSCRTVGFGEIKVSMNDIKKQATNFFEVSYANLGDSWSIQLYSNDGDDGAENLGLGGLSDNSIWMPLKCWCLNFGPQENTNINLGPDEENIYFWSGYDFNNDGDRDDVFTNGIFIESTNTGTGRYPFDLDGDGFIEGDGFDFSNGNLSEAPVWLYVPEKNSIFDRILTSRETDLGGSFRSHFAVDLSGIMSQEYQAELIIEVVIE